MIFDDFGQPTSDASRSSQTLLHPNDVPSSASISHADAILLPSTSSIYAKIPQPRSKFTSLKHLFFLCLYGMERIWCHFHCLLLDPIRNTAYSIILISRLWTKTDHHIKLKQNSGNRPIFRLKVYFPLLMEIMMYWLHKAAKRKHRHLHEVYKILPKRDQLSNDWTVALQVNELCFLHWQHLWVLIWHGTRLAF